MTPYSIVIRNFMAFRQAEHIFETGLIAVKGINSFDPAAKSNGSGKSSFFDAFSWGQYGKTARGLASDGVINRDVGKDCYVSITYHDAGAVYVITRTRSKGKGKLKFTKNGKDLTAGTTAMTQKLIDTFLGRDYDIFLNANYMGQCNIVELPKLTPTALAAAVENAVGTASFAGMLKHVREDIKAVVTNIGYKAAEIKDLDQERDMALVRSEAEIDKLESKIRVLTEQRDEYKSEPDTDAAEDGSDMAGLLAGRADIGARLEAAVAAAKDFELQVLARDKAGARVSAARNELDDIEGRIVGLEELASTVKTTNRCHTCDQELSNAKVLEDIKAEYESLLDQRTVAMATWQKLKLDLEAIVLPPFDDGDAPVLRSKLKQINNDISKLEGRLEADVGREARIKHAAERIEAITAEIEQLHVEMQAADTGKAAAEHRHILERAALSRDLTKLKTRLRILEKSAKAFESDGVRAHLIDQVTPYLNQQTADYLGTLSDGQITADWNTLDLNADGRIVERFVITVDGLKDGYLSLSGGERRKVILACMLALQDVIALRAAKPFDFFLADEIDNHLDASGFERLMSLMKERSGNTPVYIVSHIGAESWVNDTLVIRKTEKGSLIGDG